MTDTGFEPLHTVETETRNAYQLANLADCASPDSLESPGAVFLLRVQDAVAEQIESEEGETMADVLIYEAATEIADNAADLIYTHTIWTTFLDLAAYQEYDELVSEYGLEGVQGGGNYSGMEGAAVLCLYQIAERLALALLEEAAENATDDDDEED